MGIFETGRRGINSAAWKSGQRNLSRWKKRRFRTAGSSVHCTSKTEILLVFQVSLGRAGRLYWDRGGSDLEDIFDPCPDGGRIRRFRPIRESKPASGFLRAPSLSPGPARAGHLWVAKIQSALSGSRGFQASTSGGGYDWIGSLEERSLPI